MNREGTDFDSGQDVVKQRVKMFGKLFNTLSATINMEPVGPGGGPNASGQGAPSFPSLSDFGLGSLTALLHHVLSDRSNKLRSNRL